MNLHISQSGKGAPLVLIHGWGMHGGIWDNVVPQLSRTFCVHCVDLPGHGLSRYSTSDPLKNSEEMKGIDQLDDMVDELSNQLDGPLNICGWSLGGLVALRWAKRLPLQVQRLVLVASTPCFAEGQDWKFGMDKETLQQFATELEQSHVATLRRFLALQVRGSLNERELLSELRIGLFSHGEPDINALRGGLGILRDVDLRGELAAIHQPTLLIAGERDKLTPPEASFYMAQAMPDARCAEIAGAAHTPFLSHTEIFVQKITDFLHG
jgi:pimeloyl-[acyl-carrier protein] methyl ester esterase